MSQAVSDDIPSVPRNTQPPAEQQDRPQRSAALAVVVIGSVLLALSFMINAMDRQVFYPLLPAIRTEFGFSLDQAGVLATSFTLGLAVAGLVGGHLVDRAPRKMILLLSVIVFSAGTLLLPLAVGFADMAAYRILSGIGEGMQTAAIYAIGASYFFRRRTLVFGVLSAVFGTGVFFGPIIGTTLSQGYGTWRAPFVVLGCVGLVMVAAIAIGARRSMTENRTAARPHEVAGADHLPASPYNRNTLSLGIASAAGGLVFYGFLGLYPTYLHDVLAFSPGQTALASGLIGAGAAMGILFGWLGDRGDQRRLLIGTYVAVAIVAWFVFHGPTSPAWQCVLAFLMGTFASGALFPNCNSAMTRAVRPHQIGRGEGLFLVSYYTAAAVSGLVFARLIQALGWGGAALWQFTVLPLLAVGALWFVDPSKQIRGVRG
ncbi:MFS transporter [Pseudonocardia sp. GCM10023141]|uniref:MFS transporter n=1 Tax=Pseudonocardia sp. GCM10023141 TaxID=3252653 RepID=UPI003615917C